MLLKGLTVTQRGLFAKTTSFFLFKRQISASSKDSVKQMTKNKVIVPGSTDQTHIP